MLVLFLTAMPCTSWPRTWGLGSVKKDPGPIVRPEYYKWNVERRCNFDVRPTELQSDKMTQSEIVSFLSTINCDMNVYIPSLWELTIPIEYKDFESSPEDCLILEELCNQLYDGLRKNVSADPFLIPGSVGQTKSDAWVRHRRLLITSSNCKRVLGLSTPVAKMNYQLQNLWGVHEFRGCDATTYGNKNENFARESYTQVLQKQNPTIIVEQTGMWVKKDLPHLGCSPDGLVLDRNGKLLKIVEIKCPSVMRRFHPRDFDVNLTPQQKRTISICRTEDGNIKLKENHSHYYQVQFQMSVMKVSTCDYVVWSPRGFIIINVKFKSDFWNLIVEQLNIIHGSLIAIEYFQQRAVRGLVPEDFETTIVINSPQ